MKILKIHIDGFGKLHDFDIVPGDGVSVFFGCNEAGKSTLHLFIRSVLYGASTKRKAGMKSVYERMRPWQQPSVYRGRMEIEHEQQVYMIERDFNKAPDDISIFEEKNGESVRIEDAAGFMDVLLAGLSETAYVNTVSSGQLGAATQKDMAAELRKYAANVSGTMNPDINAEKAIEMLTEQHEEVLSAIDQDAARNYTAVLSEIKKIDEELARPENENKITLYTEAARKAGEDSEELSKKIASGQEELERYRQELGSKGFSQETDIEAVSQKVNSEYAELKETGKKAFSRVTVVLIIILILAAAGLAAAAWYIHDRISCIFLLTAAALAAVTALIFIFRLSEARKRWKKGVEELSGMMAPYIGEQKPDDQVMSAFGEYIDNARAIVRQMNSVRSKQAELSNAQADINREHAVQLDNLELQRQTKTKVEAQLMKLNELKKQAAALSRKIKANSILREKADALELARETLEELAVDVRNAAGTYINSEASKMIAALTGNAYTSINAGMNYDVQLNSKDGMISVSDMSAGTADQVYLALRLATIRFITGEDDPLPLILDDSFNLYDDGRLSSALKFITGTYRGQILIFTCQKREEALMDELGIPYTGLLMK